MTDSLVLGTTLLTIHSFKAFLMSEVDNVLSTKQGGCHVCRQSHRDHRLITEEF